MKRTIYIINAILFMGCCLLVSTTTPNVKDADVNHRVTYVNSDAIKKEEVIEVAPVEMVSEVVEEQPVVKETPKVEEESKEEVVIGKDEIIDEDKLPVKPEEDVYVPPITVGSTFNGSMSGYGSDVEGSGYTYSGHNIKDSIYYPDHTYGNIRILAGDGDRIPMGTVIEVNCKIGNFIAIVLDTGRNIGFGRVYDFDLLFKTSDEAWNYGVDRNATFKILRVGY